MKAQFARNASCRYLIGLVLTLVSVTAMAIEEPQYAVVEKDGDIELRRYEPMIVAEVLVEGDMDKASGKGFRMIAGYIFGDNQSTQDGESSNTEEKISMTAPVTMAPETMAPETAAPETSEKISMTAPVTLQKSMPQESTTPDSTAQNQMWRVHFVMPSEYTMASLPKPNNDEVNLREIPAQNYAAIRFSGLAGEKKVAKQTQALLDWLDAKGITPVSAPELARYNPPWTLPFMRRNEILVRY